MNLISLTEEKRQKEANSEQRTDKKKLDLKEIMNQQMVLKQGKWTQTEREHLINLIKDSYKTYPKDLERQVKNMHFHLQEEFGKRIQILIHQKSAMQGHCFYAVDGKYFEYQYENLIYIIWKVKLIEDAPLEKEY